jgi:hypothetical protein
LTRAFFFGTEVAGVALVGVALVGVALDGASLVGASLVGASLVGAWLDGASLDGASPDGVVVDGAALVDVGLDGEAAGRAAEEPASAGAVVVPISVVSAWASGMTANTATTPAAPAPTRRLVGSRDAAARR